MISWIQTLEKHIDFELLQRLLIGASIVAILLIPIDRIFLIKADLPIISPASQSLQQSEKREFDLSLDAYEAALKQTALLGIAGPQAAATVAQASIAELTKDLRLKGIMVLGEPEAIIQDARDQKTVFVRAGQEVGALKVKEIRENSIVFESGMEQKELQIE